MDINEIKNLQYRVLVKVEQLGVNMDTNEFKNFKQRVFENIKYLLDIDNKIK